MLDLECDYNEVDNEIAETFAKNQESLEVLKVLFFLFKDSY